MRVLAVDDDYLVLMNTTIMLEELGHQVVEAGSAEQALEVLGEGNFDLIVTDFAMPKTNGYELMQQVKLRSPEMPVVMVSGYAKLPDEIRRTVELVSKPFSLSQLSAAIARVVGHAG